MKLELEAKHVAEGLVLAHVGLDKRDEELIVIRATLVHLQDDVQHTVWVQIETS